MQVAVLRLSGFAFKLTETYTEERRKFASGQALPNWRWRASKHNAARRLWPEIGVGLAPGKHHLWQPTVSAARAQDGSQVSPSRARYEYLEGAAEGLGLLLLPIELLVSAPRAQARVSV